MMNKIRKTSMIVIPILTVILLGAILIYFFVNGKPKTPATTEQVRDAIISFGYEPQDITEQYHNENPDLKQNLNNCIIAQKDDMRFEFYDFTDENSASNLYRLAWSEIMKTRETPYAEVDTMIANYCIYSLKTPKLYSVAIYVGNTAVYAYCDAANRTKVDEILTKIGYFK